MENYVIYVNNDGFFESMGHNGITFTKEIDRAFQMGIKSARDIVKNFENSGKDCCILKVIECWNAYVWPRLITDNEMYFLVSNGIQTIRESGFGRENVPAMMAAVVLISIPLIVLFLIFHKKIMEGVSRGGTKG